MAADTPYTESQALDALSDANACNISAQTFRNTIMGIWNAINALNGSGSAGSSGSGSSSGSSGSATAIDCTTWTTWINQGTATSSTASTTATLSGAGQDGDINDLIALGTAPPAGSFLVTFPVTVSNLVTNYQIGGLAIANTSAGFYRLFGLGFNGGPEVILESLSSPTTWTANLVRNGINTQSSNTYVGYFQVFYDATGGQITYYYSADGTAYSSVYSESVSSAPTFYGIGVNPDNTSSTASTTVQVANPSY